MKKMPMFIITLAMTFLMLCTVCMAAPQENNDKNNYTNKDKIAILLMGSNEFKSTHYFTMIKEQFSKNNPHAEQIALGSDIQNKYQEYRLNKGFSESSEEQQLSHEDMLALPASLETDKVLVIIVKDPVIKKHTTVTLTASGEKFNASVQIDALLVDKDKIIKNQAVRHEDASFSSELRAKRNAFSKCLKELRAVMLPLF